MGNATTIEDLRRETNNLSRVNQKLAENENALKCQANKLAEVQIDHENFLRKLTHEEKRLQQYVDANAASHALDTEKHLYKLNELAKLGVSPEEQLKAFESVVRSRPHASDYSVL